MELKIFTQSAFIKSETFFKFFENTHYTRKVDYPFVGMTIDLIVSENENDEEPELDFRIENKMWDDPTIDEDGRTNGIAVGFSLNLKEVEYLQKHIEAFLKTNQ